MQDTIEDKFKDTLVDEYNNLLAQDIPSILQYLDYNHGKVRSEEAAKKEIEVMTMM